MEKTKFSPSVVWVLRGVALLVMVAIPIIHPDDYSTRILSLALIFSIAALGMQLLIGFAGQLSIGQAAFLGIGAYSSAILTSKLGIAFPIAFLLSGCCHRRAEQASQHLCDQGCVDKHRAFAIHSELLRRSPRCFGSIVAYPIIGDDAGRKGVVLRTRMSNSAAERGPL
jgi:hypothetical protein